ncbi:MAG TPA: hypothetical protein VGO47_13595 [Chlamydiales bacterium]|nr:hypothetical protein [Chlamydiales bacterium]
MSDLKALLAQDSKLDGTNWEDWSRGTSAALMYGDSWGIASGEEPKPSPIIVPARPVVPATATSPAIPAVPESISNQTLIDDWNKRNRKGLSLVVLSCTKHIQKRLDFKKSLKENWDLLELSYGTTTGLSIWVDFQKFTRSELSLSSPLSEQLDDLTNLSTRINAGGITITDATLALVMVLALPPSFEVTKQTILASCSKASDLTSIDVRQRILSEELRQGTSSNVSAIHAGNRQFPGKGKCFWCEGNHWEADCQRKARGLTKEQARAERKKNNDKKKDKARKKERPRDNLPSANIAAVTPVPPPSINVVTSNAPVDSPPVNIVSSSVPNNTTFLFYITRSAQWMLDSGCTDHMTNDLSDFSSYTPLPTSYVTLADKNKTRIEFYGKGVINGTTDVDGQKKTVVL